MAIRPIPQAFSGALDLATACLRGRLDGVARRSGMCCNSCGMLAMLVRAVVTAVMACAGLVAAEAPAGQTIYQEKCAACHDDGVNRAPLLASLHRLSSAAVLRALESGSMKFAAEGLTAEQRNEVARHVGRGAAETVPSNADCPAGSAWAGLDPEPRWTGWSPDLENTRFQGSSAAGLSFEQTPKLTLAWAFGAAGANMSRAAVTIAGGWLFTGSLDGNVYALDAKTGCTHWSFKPAGRVRGAIPLAEVDGRTLAFLGDGAATAYALDASTGKLIWKREIETHPAAVVTGSPVYYEGRLYVPMSSYEEASGARPDAECCKFRGSVSALDAATGEVRWKTYTVAEEPSPRKKNARDVQQWGPSGAAIWSAPTIDAKLGRLYVTTGDNYSDPPTDTSDAMLALDLEDGSIVWSRQFTEGDAYNMACGGRRSGENCPESNGPDFDFGSSAILRYLPDGRRVLVAGQKSGWVHAVDPDRNGKIVWQQQAGAGGVLGGVQFGSAADERRVYVAVSDIRFGQGGMLPTEGGGVTAYDLATGEEIWTTEAGDCAGRQRCSPAHSGAVSAVPGVVFAGSLDGRIRAYAADSGEVIWEYDTVREYETVNGVKGRGGSLNGAGPVIADGMLYVNSGYGQFGSMPGNVLLAFRVEEDR